MQEVASALIQGACVCMGRGPPEWGEGERCACGHSRKGPQPGGLGSDGTSGEAGPGRGEVARHRRSRERKKGCRGPGAEGKPSQGLLEPGVRSAAGPGCGEAGAEGTWEAGQWRVQGQG